MKRDLRWFEEYAQNADILKPLTQQEWRELAALLHEVNSRDDRTPNAEAHGRRSRTVQPLVGGLNQEGNR